MTYFRRAAALSRHASEQTWRRGLRWVGLCWMFSGADPELEAGTVVLGAASKLPEAIADAAGDCDWQALQLLSFASSPAPASAARPSGHRGPRSP